MKKYILLFLLSIHFVFGVDFDCVFIGSSPIPLFEAIYQRLSGKTVLILEQAGECGGAWKSIDICGIPQVDLGCHTLGGNFKLKTFLENYGGCQFVLMEPSSGPRKGFYFSRGCYELIHNLMKIMAAIGIELRLNHRLDSIYIDEAAGYANIKTQGRQFSVSKIYYTAMSSFHIENVNTSPLPPRKTKYPHLYLLIQDPAIPKFAYMSYNACEASRAMNLTRFAGLENTGRQLIVFQMRNENSLNNGENILEDLKKRDLIDPSAYLLKMESYIYELDSIIPNNIPVPFKPFFELIHASSFSNMSNYISRWKEVLRPYREICP